MSENNDTPMPKAIDDNIIPAIPKSIYFGGAAFGVSFCKFKHSIVLLYLLLCFNYKISYIL